MANKNFRILVFSATLALTFSHGMSNITKFDVLGLGCNAVDEFLFLETFPRKDAKVRIRHRRRQCGGQTVNALVAAKRCGASCQFAGQLGTGSDAQFLQEFLRNEGIGLDYAIFEEGLQPIRSTIMVDQETNSRTILYDLENTAGAPQDSPAENVIRASRVLYLDHYGVEGMTRAGQIAKAAKIPIVADFEHAAGPGFDALLELVNHLILSKDFAASIAGTPDSKKIIEYLWNEGREVVIITDGENGCWFREKTGDSNNHFPAFVVDAVDTSGCGDVFHGVYAALLAQGKSLQQRLQWASAAGAIMATREGSSEVIPKTREISDFLQQQSDSN